MTVIKQTFRYGWTHLEFHIASSTQNAPVRLHNSNICLKLEDSCPESNSPETSRQLNHSHLGTPHYWPPIRSSQDADAPARLHNGSFCVQLEGSDPESNSGSRVSSPITDGASTGKESRFFIPQNCIKIRLTNSIKVKQILLPVATMDSVQCLRHAGSSVTVMCAPLMRIIVVTADRQYCASTDSAANFETVQP